MASTVIRKRKVGTLAAVTFRTATTGDAPALHALIGAHQREGHLLPRRLDEIRAHVSRFVVCEAAGAIVACAELAPLSSAVAEVRSLVVSTSHRSVGIATRLVDEVRRRATSEGFETLCAFTHDPRFFLRQSFTVVPHASLTEKIQKDCVTCPLFGRCGQHAMVLPLVPVSQRVPYAPERVAVAVA